MVAVAVEGVDMSHRATKRASARLQIGLWVSRDGTLTPNAGLSVQLGMTDLVNS